MSSHSPVASPSPLGKRPTIAAIIDHVFQDESLPIIKRRNLRMALRTIARGCNRQPEEFCVDPPELRKQLDETTAAMAGVTEGAWKNALSLTRFALRHVGLIKPLANPKVRFAPRWTALLALMPGKHDPIALSRLARFCTVQNIDPDDVNDAVFDAFLKELEQALVRRPRKVHQRAAVVWNTMANTTRNWPTQTITVPNYSKTYFVGWDRFPATLLADVEAHLHSVDGSDKLGSLELRPLKPSSIRTRRLQLGAYLSALVLQGEDPAALRTLADALKIERVQTGLQFFLARAPTKSTKQAYVIAVMLLSVARHWVEADPASILDLKKFCKRLSDDSSMAPKVRKRLRQFDDEQAVQKLLALPGMLVAQARGREGKPTPADALLVQSAVAIELLLMVPIRRQNLVALDIQQHIECHRSGTVYLTIPGAQVKNGVDIEAILPPSLVKLMDLYLAQYRPLLDPGNTSSWLFPGWPRRHKSRERFASQIRDTIKQQTGLLVNVHLFRAIAAKIYLDRNPGGYGVVKHLHGHKSLATTIRSYCGLEGKKTIAHYDQLITEKRNAPLPTRRRKVA